MMHFLHEEAALWFAVADYLSYKGRPLLLRRPPKKQIFGFGLSRPNSFKINKYLV